MGSGFGGLFAAKHLRRLPVDVTLLSRTSHHLFQPLLYQVATGVLSEGEVAPATREILRRQDDAEVLLGDVVAPYDSLVVAAGAGPSYFGHEEFAEFAPGMKSIDEAWELQAASSAQPELWRPVDSSYRPNPTPPVVRTDRTATD